LDFESAPFFFYRRRIFRVHERGRRKGQDENTTKKNRSMRCRYNDGTWRVGVCSANKKKERSANARHLLALFIAGSMVEQQLRNEQQALQPNKGVAKQSQIVARSVAVLHK
jgi:hypothetical protein